MAAVSLEQIRKNLIRLLFYRYIQLIFRAEPQQKTYSGEE
jgi:hypothetical protein